VERIAVMACPHKIETNSVAFEENVEENATIRGACTGRDEALGSWGLIRRSREEGCARLE
jgi:hypothetical protein